MNLGEEASRTEQLYTWRRRMDMLRPPGKNLEDGPG
jgi:hypothetical protein